MDKSGRVKRGSCRGLADRRSPVAVFAAALLVQACGEPPPPAEPVVRPVRYVTAQATGGQRTRTFSGVARAGFESSLSFRVAGTIARLDVEVGDRIRAGAPIAEIDPVDYELQVREAEASLRQAEARAGNAEADLRRVRSLYENDNAARTDLDAATAAADSAAAQVESVAQRLDLARRQVDYTHLTAPAAGAIADVLAEVNENVSPGQPVVVLASGSAPEVGFAVPEALIREVREGMPVSVGFDAIPGARFDGLVTEVGVTTTATGTTFPVTVRLGAGASDIRSGMAAVVDMILGDAEAPDRFILPGPAVGEDRGGRFVFVAEPAGDGLAVVRRRPVMVGAFAVGGLEVLDGLTEGERVVVAGVNRLQDGDEVRLDAAGAP
ncbi:MAG: efflux RND transporter periplasmic adaptor subunit [Acidobacteria bacterium]|nr:efflux RND transporter periplasmic adaptor subunit [Acidobacteriota bacterium]